LESKNTSVKMKREIAEKKRMFFFFCSTVFFVFFLVFFVFFLKHPRKGESYKKKIKVSQNRKTNPGGEKRLVGGRAVTR